jgi:ELWxxDGT repeat protein
VALNGVLYFTAYTPTSGYQVWQSNGTAGGTVMDTSLNTGATNVPTNFAATTTALDFTAPGATLWVLTTSSSTPKISH